MNTTHTNDATITCPICKEVFLWWQWESHTAKGHTLAQHLGK